jgi:response regulator NasT
MRLLVVDESRDRARVLRAALENAGHEVVVSLGAPLALLAKVTRVQPDVIIIHTESPTRDVIEHLVVMREQAPRPIVLVELDGTILFLAASGESTAGRFGLACATA